MNKTKNVFVSITLTKEMPVSLSYSAEEKEEMDRIMSEELKKLMSEPTFNDYELDSVLYQIL